MNKYNWYVFISGELYFNFSLIIITNKFIKIKKIKS